MRRLSVVPVMADGTVLDTHDALRAVRKRACALINIKLMKSGGLLAALTLDAVAERREYALYVLVASMPALPAMHPRMASEQDGPTPTKQLEPPGFMALNYGRRTPITVILAHLLYGVILGTFYRLK